MPAGSGRRNDHLIRSKITAVQISPLLSDGLLAGVAVGGLVRLRPVSSTAVVSKCVSKPTPDYQLWKLC